MTGTLLFVHGTGVRGERFASSLGLIEKAVANAGLDLRVAGCYWGDAEGARLRADGRSIPTYDRTGGEPVTEKERQLALWVLLYTDPWYELRLLRHQPKFGGVAPGARPPAAALRDQVERFAPSDVLADMLAAAGLTETFVAALAALRAAPELSEAAATAPAEPLEHRRAIARALVAHALVSFVDAGGQPLDGRTRDAIVERVTDELEGYGLGVASFLTGQVKGLAARLATRRLTKDRGAITDAASPMAGDILRFLARGDGLRAYLTAAIDDHAARGDVHVLGHSLGGIMSVDLLARAPHPAVKRLVTVGSQAPFLYEIDALPALPYPDPLPGHFPAWTNVYDRRDILSYLGAGIFGDRVADVEVDNGEPFPQAHSAYWTNDAVWQAIGAALK